MNKHKYLVLIETSGNQHYIFSTNKLRENIGASELTFQIGTTVILKAVGKTLEDPLKLHEFLVSPTDNPPIEDDKDEKAAEVIIATSGKALLLTNTNDRAKEIVADVTRTALEDMPGLTVHGAIVEVAEDLSNIHEAIGQVHRKLENLRYELPSTLQRFQRLPFVEPCATSGLPATRIYRHETLETKPDELKPHSILSIRKQDYSKQGRIRLEKAIDPEKDVMLMDNINELEKKFEETKWLAIIHADGNGVGKLFLNFEEYSGATDGRGYIKDYRNFSIALDICTLNAVKFAVEKFQTSFQKSLTDTETIELPLVPLVLGGDDLTVICDGEYAIKFTHDFLSNFEDQSQRLDIKEGIIPGIAEKAFGVSRLGICAGVAIIKPHYPFHQAYSLASQLINSAKKVKTEIKHTFTDSKQKVRTESLPCSAMDFHVLYDSSGVNLEQIRSKLELFDEATLSSTEPNEEATVLYSKPYVVTTKTLAPDDATWLAPRFWKDLSNRVEIMIAKDLEGKSRLPNSQLHNIRESLFRGHVEAAAELELLAYRYDEAGIDALYCQPADPNGSTNSVSTSTIFYKEFVENRKRELIDGYRTHFLDAIEVTGLWKGFELKMTNSSNDLTGGGE